MCTTSLICCSSVVNVNVFVQSLSSVQLFVIPWTATRQASLSLASPRICSNFCPLSQWWHPTISSSVIPFSSCPQSFPASGSFPMSWLFASGSQSTGALASTSVLPTDIQDWFPLRLTGLISLQSKGLSRVFSSTLKFKTNFNYIGTLTTSFCEPRISGEKKNRKTTTFSQVWKYLLFDLYTQQ